jgi:hypothetical protein
VVATAGRALTAATPRSERPSAFIARPSAAFGKSVGQYFTPHNVMGSRCVAEDADGEEAIKTAARIASRTISAGDRTARTPK